MDRKIMTRLGARAGGVARIFNDLCLEQGRNLVTRASHPGELGSYGSPAPMAVWPTAAGCAGNNNYWYSRRSLSSASSYDLALFW